MGKQSGFRIEPIVRSLRGGRTLDTARAVFGALVALEAIGAVPLAVTIASSRAALACVAAILVMLDAALVSTATRGPWRPALSVSIVLASGGCVALALHPHGPSWGGSIAAIAGVNVCVLAFGLVTLPDSLQGSFAAQRLALASTLTFWILIEHFRPALDALHVAPFGPLGMGLKFLFIGPLALVPIAFLGGLAGWNEYLTALAGVCVGQWGMGCIELGFALGVVTLIIGGFIMGLVFGLLALSALWRGLNPPVARTPFR